MLLDRLLHWTDQNPEKLAVADPFRQLNYAQLTTLAKTMRGLILRNSRCERVGILLPGSAAFAGCLFGCFWAGRVAVPLNFLLSSAEIRRIVQDAKLDLIITIHHFSELAKQIGIKTLFLENSGLKFKFLLNKLWPTPPTPKVTESQIAVILYTSGTAAEPKGVMLSYGNLASNCRDSIAHAQIRSDHTLLSVLPPFHIFGLTAMTLLPLWEGMTVHYIPRFNPHETVKTIEEKQISIFMAIPSMYAAMLRVKKSRPESLRSLYLAISGGEPLQDSTARMFQENFGLTLHQGYGLTETSPVVSIDLPWSSLTGSVGKTIPNCQARIADPNGTILPADQDGEIQLRGPGMMQGYYQKEQETATTFTPDGWFKTGDQGRINMNGFLSITGRIKDMMIVGGENVFPREIENALTQHGAVEEAAVIGVPDSSRGEVPLAFVILKEGQQVDENELRSLCRDQLASFKVPREVRICKDLPRGPTGKILKRALKEQLLLTSNYELSKSAPKQDQITMGYQNRD